MSMYDEDNSGFVCSSGVDSEGRNVYVFALGRQPRHRAHELCDADAGAGSVLYLPMHNVSQPQQYINAILTAIER